MRRGLRRTGWERSARLACKIGVPSDRSTPRTAPPRARLVSSLLVTMSFLVASTPATAQTVSETLTGGATDEQWNSARVLSLIERATEVRQDAAGDPDLRTYRADARGYVYFFLDRPDDGERVLIKADQVALEVLWRSPGQTRQTIVGMRDEKLLPTRVRYHLDHLTVVTDDFGESIRFGDGDEVDAVPHPTSQSGRRSYDYRLADSLSITHSDGLAQVRVYEIQVRPKDMSQPGYIGTLFVDRDRASIVRMNFSFTPASYVDETLDYIRVSLDNSLWDDRYWLPWRQETEIRREAPFLDFQSGSVIRQRFRVSGYDFNVDLAPGLFRGAPVRSLSLASREAFPFERGLLDDLEESGGLVESPSMEAVEEQVREVVEDEVLSGLARVRLFGDGVSDFARFNRAEGVFLGGGVTFRPTGRLDLRTRAGYAFGRSRPSGGVTLTHRSGRRAISLEGRFDDVGDIGGFPGSTPLENTISSATGSKDYLDPYFRRGATLAVRWGAERSWAVSATLEEHVGALDVVSDGPETEFRPVRSIDEGTMATLDVTARSPLPGRGDLTVTTTLGRIEGSGFGRIDGHTRWRITGSPWHADVSLSGGGTTSGAPSQSLFLIGGRETLLGHDYRSYAGRAYAMSSIVVTVPVWAPYVGVRVFGTAASTWLGDSVVPADWAAMDTDGVRGSVGMGLSLGWDSFYFDVGRAVGTGGWEAMMSVAPQFRGWL